MNKRKKRLAVNTISSFFYRIVTVVCGFIIPRLVLSSFGSEVNGILHSITQFLGIITLLDMGVGTVVQSSLYKPLADEESIEISKIYSSASKFFRRIAYILLLYIVVLIFAFPYLSTIHFSFYFTTTLILAVSVSYFFQYYFGIVNTLLIQADQKGYIQDFLQIVTLIVNTSACALLIKAGASIQLVRLSTSIIFLIRPFFLYIYVKNHYIINKKITYVEEPIKQKWNGMAQHFASFVLTGTDNIVLTLFSSLSNVSIYSIYSMVVTGVFELLVSLTNGLFPYLGDMWAREEKDELRADFAFSEWLIHNASILVFGCTGVLIVNFIKVYTEGINDANYVQPVFSTILVLAYTFRALRIPYNYLILAAGHYKQTQSNYILAALMNIIISIVFVFKYGLIGVAIGTIIAMAYQTLWMAKYDYKVFLNASFNSFLKQLLLDLVLVVVGSSLSTLVDISVNNYISWIIKAFFVLLIWTTLLLSVNIVIYKKHCFRLLSIIKLIK